MFRTKTSNSLSSPLNSVNKFIADLKEGVAKHSQKIGSINEEINDLYVERENLQSEIDQANKMIGTLSGTNS